ncbi:hypothetical protein [Acetanaerobacterium elongatum]|uniref:Uncharacterized protein n=1 Tax=Acetanaerobacterium elongatum TaxID=258515 RepID=A0A1H0CEI5_9FIRM|nr:hypothetical protein [Acetanaerobacterium elongatum]SDN56223.1 hypothetical protein SAMN05192585_1236 [Acetanaerobacterium elongatum]
MKKLIAIILVLLITCCILPCNMLSAESLGIKVSPNELRVINQANKAIYSGIIAKCIKSENYAYWNFYTASDTNIIKAYGYRYADALYNLDIIKALTPVSITESDAKSVIEGYIVEYTKQNSEKYQEMALIEGLLDTINKGSDAYTALVDMRSWNANIDGEKVKLLISKLTPWKEKMELCLSRGDLDEETRAWILNGELKKTTDTLLEAQQYDKLLFTSSLISNGLKAINFSQDLYSKYEELKILKYASKDALNLLDLLSTTAIDSNIKKAAIGVKRNLEKYKSADMPQLLSYATGDTVKDFISNEVLDKLKNMSFDALKATGIKGCMYTGSLLKAVEVGVVASNILFNAGNTLEQANKIRVISLISVSLSQKTTEELSKFVMASNTKIKAEAAEELLKYLYMLVLSRELGELQYYNMRQSANNGTLTDILKYFGYNSSSIDDWYNRVSTEMKDMKIQLGTDDSLLDPGDNNPNDTNIQVSEADKKKIYKYLCKLSNYWCELPNFNNAENIDSAYIVLTFHAQADNPIEYNSEFYEFSSLVGIEKVAREILNPQITLKKDADYSSLDGMSRKPQWIPELEGFIWYASGGFSKQYIPYLTNVTYSDGLYYVTGNLIRVEWNAEYDATEGKMYCNNVYIGTLYYPDPEIYTTSGFEFTIENMNPQFTTDINSLPKQLFVLQPNGDSFYLLSKTDKNASAVNNNVPSVAQPSSKQQSIGFMNNKNLLGADGYISKEDQIRIQNEIDDLYQEYGCRIYFIVSNNAYKKELNIENYDEFYDKCKEFLPIDEDHPYYILLFNQEYNKNEPTQMSIINDDMKKILPNDCDDAMSEMAYMNSIIDHFNWVLKYFKNNLRKQT